MSVQQFVSPFADPDDKLDNVAIVNFDAGNTSDVLIIRIYADRGNPAGLVRINGMLLISTEDPQNPDIGLGIDIEPQDEFWGEARFVGQSANNTEFTTDWKRLGAFTGIDFPGLQPDSFREYQLRFTPPSHANTPSNYRFFLRVFLEETSFAIPGQGSIEKERGVVVGTFDLRATYLFEGLEVVPSIVPDDNVIVQRGRAYARGIYHGFIDETFTFDELDGDSPPVQLLVGESYEVLISMSPLGVIEALKGLGAGTPIRPSLPAEHAFLKYVQVFENGGVPEIDVSDLNGNTLYGRFHLEQLGGLLIRIHTGNAVAGGTARIWSTFFDITLTASVTSYVWQLQNGKWTVIEDDAEPPNVSSLLYYIIVTDGVGILSVEDSRVYATKISEIRFSAPVTATGLIFVSPYLQVPVSLDKVVVAIDSAQGTSGDLIIDIELNGSSIYTSQGTQDLRPRFPFDTTALIDTVNIHEAGEIKVGDRLEVLVDEVPAGSVNFEMSVSLLEFR